MNEPNEQDQRVLRLIQEGESNRQIGDQLQIRHEAVSFHTRRLLDSYGVKTLMELRHATRQAPPYA